MNCLTLDQKNMILEVNKKIQSNDLSTLDKIDAINELQDEMYNPSLFAEAKNTLILISEQEKSGRKLVLNAKEKAFARDLDDGTYDTGTEAKPIVKGFILDSQKYIAVHSAKSIRVVDAKTMKDIGTFKTTESSIKERNKDIVSRTSTVLTGEFQERLDRGMDFTTLGERIVNTLRNKHKVENGNKIPVERKIIKSKDNAGLFASIQGIFSGNETRKSMNELLNGNLEEKTKYAEEMNKILNFIPANIKEIIFGEEKPEQKEEFNNNIQHFLNVFDDMNVPAEEVWRQNFKVKENGELVQIGHSKYVSPNYLQLIGKFKTIKNENVTGSDISDQLKQSDRLELDPAVEEIVKFYSVKAMADMKEMIELLNGKNIEQVSKLMDVDMQTAYKIKTDFIESNTIPVSSFISDAAKDAYSQLGITMNSDMNVELKDGLVASLAALIQATLVNSEYITHNSAKSEKEIVSQQANDAKNQDIPGNDSAYKAEVNAWAKAMYSEINEKYNFTNNSGQKNLAMYTLNIEEFSKKDGENVRLNGYKEAFGIVNKLKYLNINENRQMPTLVPVTNTAKNIKNKTYNVNPDIETFVQDQNQVAWRYKGEFEEMYVEWMKTKILESDTTEQKAEKNALKDQILHSLGKETVTDGHHISEVKKIMSNNDKIERDLNTLSSMYEAFKGKDMYLPWAEIANGRAAIQSDMNPQESKLIRSFIEQPTQPGSIFSGHNVHMNMSDFAEGTETVEMLEMALSQALDMDPDKNSKKTVLEDIRSIVDITGSDVTITTKDKNGKEIPLGKALHTITTGSDKQKIADAYNTVFNKGEGHHGLQAARMLKRLVEWKGQSKEYRDKNPFNNNLTIETDAITSGMILTLMQIVDDSAIELLAKGGIYTEQTRGKWTEYTSKWLKIAYSMRDGAEYKDEIVFGPAALIEAGNFHQTLKEGGKVKFQDEKLTPDAAFDKYYKLGYSKDKASKQAVKAEIGTTEVFQDMYKTIGLEMQDAIQAKKIELESRTENLISIVHGLEDSKTKLNDSDKAMLNAYKREYDRLKLQSTMLEQIGEINPKVLRLIAKDPVMTYIYGSTISSIRKNLGGTVGVKNFVEAIKLQYKLKNQDTLEDTDQAKLDIASAFIDATMNSIERRTSVSRGRDSEGNPYPFSIMGSMKFKELDKEGRIVPMDRNKMLEDGMEEYKALMLMDIDEDVVGVLTKAVNDTFGDAIEEAFEAKTQSVDNYRNIMKSIELVTFEIFRAKTETMKKAILEKNDGVITQQDWNKMIKTLEETGFGHDAATGDAATTDRRIPLVNLDTGSSGKQGTATIKFDKKEIFNEDGSLKDVNTNIQTRTYAYLTGREFASNTGAAPTIIVHQMDSRAITITIGANSWLSIYDAVVQASDPRNVKETTDGYNKTVFDQNSVRDFVGDNIRKMMFMFDDLNQRIANKDKTAEVELEQIKSRLRSTEVVGYEISTNQKTLKNGDKVKERVRIPKFIADGQSHTGTLDFSNETNIAYFVDTLEKTYNDGTKVIKEVYWDNPKTGKLIGRTVLKTIKDDKMDVIVIERHDVSSLKDIGEDNRKQNTAYEMKYTVEGTKAIEQHNKKHKLDDKVSEKDVFNYPDIETIERDIQDRDQKLIDIIKTDSINSNPSKNVRDVGSLEKESGDAYVPTLAGQDFKSESQRLFLPLEAIISNFKNSKTFSETRFKNLKKFKWSLGHAAISNTVPINTGHGTGSIGKMDVRAIVNMIQEVQDGNVETNHLYVQQFIDSFKGKKLPDVAKETMSLMQGGLDESIASGSNPFIVGGDKTFGGAGLLSDIGLHNSGYYTKDSVITALPAKLGQVSLGYDNNLGFGFEALKKAVKVGATVVTGNADKEITKIMIDSRKFGLTDKDAIYIELKKHKSFKDKNLYEDDGDLERRISSYQINAYMHTMDYKNEKKDGYNVWKAEMIEIEIEGKKKILPKREVTKLIQKEC